MGVTLPSDAGLGMVEGWVRVPVAVAGTVLGGRQRSPHAVGELCPYLRVANVFDGYIDAGDVFQMRFTSSEKQRFLLEKGDILLNEGQSLELVGRSAIYRGDPPGCCFQNSLIRFRASKGSCVEYVQHVFQHFLRTGVFAAIALQTTSIAHLGTGRLGRLRIPFPPPGEQRAIATVLSDADALIESLEQLIAKKRQVKQGAMQELLTGKRRLPGFASRWEDRHLGSEIAGLVAGVSVNSAKEASAGESCTCGILKTSCVAGGVFKPWEAKPIAPADLHRAKIRPLTDSVLISRMNTIDLVGECGYVHVDCPNLFVPDRLWMTVLKAGSALSARWLAAVLSTPWSRDMIRGFASGTSGSMKNIAKGALLALRLAFPPPAEQRAIAEVLTCIDDEIIALESRLSKTRQIKQGMMQELLTGRIRLV